MQEGRDSGAGPVEGQDGDPRRSLRRRGNHHLGRCFAGGGVCGGCRCSAGPPREVLGEVRKSVMLLHWRRSACNFISRLSRQERKLTYWETSKCGPGFLGEGGEGQLSVAHGHHLQRFVGLPLEVCEGGLCYAGVVVQADHVGDVLLATLPRPLVGVIAVQVLVV